MITLTPGHLTLPQLRQIARESVQLALDPASFAKIDAGAKAVADIAAKGEPTASTRASAAGQHAHPTTSSNCCRRTLCCRTRSAWASRWHARRCAC